MLRLQQNERLRATRSPARSKSAGVSHCRTGTQQVLRYARTKSPTTHRIYLRVGAMADVREVVFRVRNKSGRDRRAAGTSAQLFGDNSALRRRSEHRLGAAVRKKAGIEVKRYVEYRPATHAFAATKLDSPSSTHDDNFLSSAA
jgi:hypothetical protein